MTMKIRAEVTGGIAALKDITAREAAAVLAGSQRAVEQQTNKTKASARQVISTGLRSSGRRQVANTIRSKYYADTPAGFVHSTWGYFQGGQFYDILGAHTHGATILPKKGKYLFVPFDIKFRRLFRRERNTDRIELVPMKNGDLLVILQASRSKVKRGPREGTVLGELVRRVKLQKRLDFTNVLQEAGQGLAQKLVVEMDRAARSTSAGPGSRAR